ncbi:MAG TPA: MaoC family dehydratase [Roseomonas sp.]|nr:MaoC family dehydratase [Roseomonas sp.]
MNDVRLEIGTTLRAPARRMTRERMRWYVDLLPTVEADDGRVHQAEPTIHDDDEFARSQGLPGIIADGMLSTNWILSLLLDAFGEDALCPGALSTRYIAPVFEDVMVTTAATVTSVGEEADGTLRYGLDVWCEEAGGRKLTVGKASVRATGSPAARAVAPRFTLGA